MTTHDRWHAPLALALVSACAAPRPPQPHDMSAARHEEAAGADDARAAAHQGAYDPEATWPSSVRCGPGAWLVDLHGPCWSSYGNPTEGHREEAERHREAAAAHRAAAAALRDVEARECAGLSDADRDQSPFSHREDIVSVSELVEASATVGATIVLRAVPGLTEEWLERALACHLARNAALGHDVPEMAYCPLVPRGVTASVRPVASGFAIDVRADGAEAAAEVLRRARLLAP